PMPNTNNGYFTTSLRKARQEEMNEYISQVSRKKTILLKKLIKDEIKPD
ncbi:25124_t:CDS:1, partial [Dentiscutata erythropus]